MQIQKALSLIQHTVSQHATTWSDLGCGNGLFTNALSQLLHEGSLIYAADKSRQALNAVVVKQGIQLEKLTLDFVNDELPFKDLSGILMANAFHFVKDKHAFISKLFNCLGKEGYFVIVEYDTNVGNTWVPYPISFNNLKIFFEAFNFATEKLNTVSSRYNGNMYSALIHKRSD